jgi:hypothetical protein
MIARVNIKANEHIEVVNLYHACPLSVEYDIKDEKYYLRRAK